MSYWYCLRRFSKSMHRLEDIRSRKMALSQDVVMNGVLWVRCFYVVWVVCAKLESVLQFRVIWAYKRYLYCLQRCIQISVMKSYGRMTQYRQYRISITIYTESKNCWIRSEDYVCTSPDRRRMPGHRADPFFTDRSSLWLVRHQCQRLLNGSYQKSKSRTQNSIIERPSTRSYVPSCAIIEAPKRHTSSVVSKISIEDKLLMPS